MWQQYDIAFHTMPQLKRAQQWRQANAQTIDEMLMGMALTAVMSSVSLPCSQCTVFTRSPLQDE